MPFELVLIDQVGPDKGRQLCMGIQPDARFPARSADALPETLYGHFTQAIYRNRPIACPCEEVNKPRWFMDAYTPGLTPAMQGTPGGVPGGTWVGPTPSYPPRHHTCHVIMPATSSCSFRTCFAVLCVIT